MANASNQNAPSRMQIWIGYLFSSLPVLFMLMSGAMKLIRSPMVIEGFAKAGMSAQTVVIIGIIELTCVVLYLIPKTAVLGAIFMTGYLGGAIMIHVRAGEASLIAPLLLGMLAWGGLYMRDPRVRALIPLRERP